MLDIFEEFAVDTDEFLPAETATTLFCVTEPGERMTACICEAARKWKSLEDGGAQKCTAEFDRRNLSPKFADNLKFFTFEAQHRKWTTSYL